MNPWRWRVRNRPSEGGSGPPQGKFPWTVCCSSVMLQAMPQPVRPTIIASFLPEKLHTRPDLAVRVAVISGIWGQIERDLGMLLAAMIGAEARTVVGMYLSLVSAPAQRASIEAVASLKLGDIQQASLKRILRKVADKAKERASVIHGAWGVSANYPNALIWADPKDIIVDTVENIQAEMDIRSRRTSVANSLFCNEAEQQKQWQVYELQDFDNMKPGCDLLCRSCLSSLRLLSIIGYAATLAR